MQNTKGLGPWWLLQTQEARGRTARTQSPSCLWAPSGAAPQFDSFPYLKGELFSLYPAVPPLFEVGRPGRRRTRGGVYLLLHFSCQSLSAHPHTTQKLRLLPAESCISSLTPADPGDQPQRSSSTSAPTGPKKGDLAPLPGVWGHRVLPR